MWVIEYIKSNKFVTAILLVVTAAVFTTGILYLFPYVPRATGEPVIRDIVVAGLRDAEERADAEPRLRSSDSYEANELLAMRVVSTGSEHHTISLGVRLLTTSGNVKMLEPSQVRVATGRATFCCWQIDEAGNYTLQIFKPDRTITSIPLRIVQGQRTRTQPFPLRK
jgi:hypothetical protein